MRTAQQIIAEAHKQALERSSDPRSAYAFECGFLRGELRLLHDELIIYTGDAEKARAGCFLTRKVLGDAEVLCEYEFERSEPDRPNADLPNPGPGHPASAYVLQVLLNGRWCDAEDVVPQHVLDRWHEELVEEHQE
jgi:hypothetical protein